MDIRVRRAAADDAGALSELAALTFRDTFADQNTADDVAQYLADTFSPERQATEIADPDGVVLLAERHASSGTDLVGYAHVIAGPAPGAIRGSRPIELKRLYVVRAWHGRGVAQALMDASLAAARARGARTMWLGVWERNPRAVAFYTKYGFTRAGEHTFQLGGDAQTDWLFARAI